MLKELEQQEKELFAQLTTVRAAITKERERIAEQDFGVRIGSIVKDRHGVEHKVTKVDASFPGKPWLSGGPKKKDGTFSTAHRNLYRDWTLVA